MFGVRAGSSESMSPLEKFRCANTGGKSLLNYCAFYKMPSMVMFRTKTVAMVMVTVVAGGGFSVSGTILLFSATREMRFLPLFLANIFLTHSLSS